MPDTIQIGTDSERAKFRALIARIKTEADGKLLRRELYAEIRGLMQPAVAEVRQGFMQMQTGGLSHAGPELRPAVAANVKVGLSSGARLTGARIYVSKKGLPRKFSNAPRDINAGQWEHPAGRGAETTVTQQGAPGVFDDPLRARAPELREAITEAMRHMADRIAAR